MSVIGTPRDWAGVIDSKVPEILQLIVTAWKQIPPGKPDELEDAITKRLSVALHRSRKARQMMFLILTQVVELDPTTSDEFGRMDIAFYPTGEGWVPREDVYFCLECKRLNVIKGTHRRSYAAEYVTLGMVRFVTGQYARAVRHGGMIGYVRDGDVSRAITNVDTNVRKQCDRLCMPPPGGFVRSALRPNDAGARETHHHRRHRESPFRIHHLFMSGDPRIEGSLAFKKKSATKRRRSV